MFFDKTSNGYSIIIDELLESILGDLIRGLDKVIWNELVELCTQAIKLYLPYEIYNKDEGNNFEGQKIIEKLWGITLKQALIVDYNDYSNVSDEFINEKNVVVQKVDWSHYSDHKSKLAYISKLKKMLTMDEVRAYFENMFQNSKDFEAFCRQNFVKVVSEVKEKYIEFFKTQNPIVVQSLVKNPKRKSNDLALMKIKLLWI
jgi:hypothetical protein